jgi:hypothetical protein
MKTKAAARTTAATTKRASGRSGSVNSAAKPAEPTPPPYCIMARVRPLDAVWIANRCKHGDRLSPWIVAGVLAEAGDGVLRGETFRGDSRPEAVLKTSTACSLWKVINRDLEDFTEEVPVAIHEAEKYHMEQDAEAFGRDLSDWVGTLIQTGIRMVEADGNLAFLTSWRGFNLLASAIELRTMKEGGRS